MPAAARKTSRAWLAAGATAALAAVCLFAAPAVAASAPHRSAAPRRIGSLDLVACGHGAYCGDYERPLDATGAIPGSVRVHFEFYPHSASGQREGTLVATEGGPGYPATLSRDDYLDLFRPLMRTRDVVLMDNRGTGRSGAIDCRELQTGVAWTVASVGACGASLGDRAALYGTAAAADDLAAILRALDVRQIDLYGDSYGTYFEQAFAIRHPDMLRSVVLDGAYPLTAPDYAWYPNYAPAMRDKFNLACARSTACAALPGTSLEHLAPALAALRTAPFAATAADVDGREQRFAADAPHLAVVMFSGAPAATSVRELDAAARAFADGDRLPLLRLMAESIAAVDSRDPSANPTLWSAGLAAAVMCHDPPQIFDMSLPVPQRAVDHERALAARRRSAPYTYAPFSLDEYRAMPLDYSFLDQCAAWPVAPAGHPAAQLGVGAVYPEVPALILSGELDDITSVADGAAVAAAFPHGRQVVLANSFHVNALPRARSPCGARLARRFLVDHDPGDLSCAASVPPLQLIGRFATAARQVAPATATPGNTASSADLRIVSAALLTAADVLARAHLNSSGRGVGLRGGTFQVLHGAQGMHVVLDRVRWSADLPVSGTLDRAAGRFGRVNATLQVSELGRMTASWRDGAAAPARIHGRFGGATVVAEMPVP